LHFGKQQVQLGGGGQVQVRGHCFVVFHDHSMPRFGQNLKGADRPNKVG
jgi:hypothetical protein